MKDREAWRAAVSLWGFKESDMAEQLNNTNQFELPESYSKFPLTIYFTHAKVYVSMLLCLSHPLIPPLFPQVHSLCLQEYFQSQLLQEPGYHNYL